MRLLGPIFITGAPAPFATEEREKKWKETVAGGIKNAWPERSYVAEPCEILLTFFLAREKLDDTDLDNLLKPCIDAIGSVIFAPASRGRRSRWNRDDHWVRRIVAEKLLATRELGVEVTVNSLRPL